MAPVNLYRGSSFNQYAGTTRVYNLGSATASAAGGSDIVINSSLTHYFDAGNVTSYGGSGTTWTNLVSGKPNIGLANGPVFVSNGAASYFRLDGVDDYMSGSGYVLPATNQTTINIVMSLHNLSGQTDRFWVAGGDPMQLEFGGYTTGGDLTWSDFTIGSVNFFADIVPFASPAPTLMTKGQTYMVTFTSDATKVSLYLNGTFVSSSTEVLSVTNYTNATFQLFYQTGTTRSGSISHLLIYTSSLSQAEITQNYNALKSRYGLP